LRSRKFLVTVITSIAVLVGSGALLGRMFKQRWPLKPLYLRYSKWRYNWRSPSDMGEGQKATQIIIEGPMGIGEDRFGNIYISDRDARLVWKIEGSGCAVVIAGTGMSTGPKGIPTGSVLARDVDLGSPEGLVIDNDGNMILADSADQLILKIDQEGLLTSIAGNGQLGFNGDSIPATQASFARPYDVRLDSDGNIYVADVLNHRVRKIGKDGLITTVAGSGVAGYTGDGGPAIAAQLNTPYGVFLDKNSNLLIADSENHVIRRVGADGIIRTIAGTGQKGYDGDGGLALKAKFDTPQSLAIDAQGRIYVGDEHNNAIRVIDLDSTVRSLVGTRGPGFSGDGGPVSAAQIADPENMWIRDDGSILISARDNSRLRIVSPEGIIYTFAGRGPTRGHEYYAPIRLAPIDR